MEVYSDQKDFITAQVVSTRDIASNLWNDWFTGVWPTGRQAGRQTGRQMRGVMEEQTDRWTASSVVRPWTGRLFTVR
jgi:hypothetical protein